MLEANALKFSKTMKTPSKVPSTTSKTLSRTTRTPSRIVRILSRVPSTKSRTLSRTAKTPSRILTQVSTVSRPVQRQHPWAPPPSSSTSPGSSSGFPSYIELNALHIIRWYDKPIRLRDMSTIDLNAYFSCYPDHMAAYIEYLRRNPGAFLPHEEGSRRQQKLHEALSKNKLVYSKTYNEIYDKKKLEKEGYRFVDGEVVCVGRKRPNNLGPLVINDWDNRPSQRTQVREEGNTMRHYWLYNNGPFFSQENRKADRRSKRSESVESQDDRQEKMDVADELETGKQAETKTETDTENLMPKNSLGATKGAAAKKAGPSWGFMSWANKIQQEREKKAEEAKKRTKQEEKKPKDKNVTFEGVSKKFRKLMGKKLEA